MKIYDRLASPILLEHLQRKLTHLEEQLQSQSFQLRKKVVQENLLTTTALRLRRSLDPITMMQTSALEVRAFLDAERVIVYRFNPNWTGSVIAESSSRGILPLLGRKISDPCFAKDWVTTYQQGRVQVIHDIFEAKLAPCHQALLANLGIRANLLVPILQDQKSAPGQRSPLLIQSPQQQDLPTLWGFLAVHQCSRARRWKPDEVKFLQKMSLQISIAIQQAQLQQVTQAAINAKQDAEQQLLAVKVALDLKVRQRTQKLERANRQLLSEIQKCKLAESQLLQENELAKITFDSIGDGVVITDAEGKIVSLNPIAEQLTGWTKEEALGQTPESVLNMVHEVTHQPVENPLIQALNWRKTAHLPESTLLISRMGQEYAISDSASPIHDAEGLLQGAVMVFHDCTPTRQLTQQLSWQATHDTLTGLANRREFEVQLGKAVDLLKTGENHQSILCFLDLDQFKIVNDACGHEAGDLLLKQVAAILQKRVRSTDTLARLGGDEFGLLLKNCSLDQAMSIVDHLRQQIQSIRFIWANHVYQIGISIGMTILDSEECDLPTLLSAADSACYAAKAKGRNCIQVYRPDDQILVQQRGERQWKTILQQALEEDRFQLYMQQIEPISKLNCKRLFEVLLRLRGDDNQLVLPTAFIPAAERYHLMPTVDRWVVESFFSQYSAFLGGTRASVKELESRIYTINLSGASLSEDSLLPFLKDRLEYYCILPHTICFEITETSAIKNLSLAAQLITELKAIGCSFALDDFGSGMSSMTYLKELPVDFLKIDGSFVQSLIRDSSDYAVVECFNRLGHSLGLQTIAEWVESSQVLNHLTQIGVDYVQGFGIAKPIPLQIV